MFARQTPLIRSVWLAAAMTASACSGPSVRPDPAIRSETDLSARLERMERAMVRLGTSLENLERDLQLAHAPESSGANPPAIDPGRTAVQNRDCLPGGRTNRQRTSFPGRSFSTW